MTGIEQSVWVDNAGDAKQVNRAAGAEGATAPGGEGAYGGQPASGAGAAMQGNGPEPVRRMPVMPPPMVPPAGTWNPQNSGMSGYGMMQGRPASETQETKRMKENYGYLARGALLYGLFYAFCMYRNGSGVPSPSLWRPALGFSVFPW